MKRIVVAGGGFAGFWSAAAAVRKLDQAGAGQDVQVTLIEKNDFHSIRVRNYEEDLDSFIIPLSSILAPIGVEQIRAEVVGIDLANQVVQARGADGEMQDVPYDRLVYALGSRLERPPIPGLAGHSFDVDTYFGAKRLERHLKSLPASDRGDEKYTALVVGAGLTGIEIACELPGRLARLFEESGRADAVRVILADASPAIGSDMGAEAQAVITEALADLGVETRTGVMISAVDDGGVTLADGERIPAATVVWCAGMRAHDLGRVFPVEKDRLGRIPVDETMRVKGVHHVYAAGDAAWSMMCEEHASVMSCQHGRPMGRYAGHNAAADLLGEPLLPLRIDWYVTVLDLGPWGAVYTGGWDRQVISTRGSAKQTKRIINGKRIYPPLSGRREDILAAAAPEVQEPPEVLKTLDTA